MIATVCSAALYGVDAQVVEVQAQVFSALKRFSIVGLPDGVIRESKDRVRCAIENSGFSFPTGEVVVSLSPVALPKFGSGFDLAMALAIIAADKQLETGTLSRVIVLGELGLDGKVKSATAAVAAASLVAEGKAEALLASAMDRRVLSWMEGAKIFTVNSLAQAAAFCAGEYKAMQLETSIPTFIAPVEGEPDISDVRGQHSAKRALQISASGGHSLLFCGPPGAGKSMLASRLPSLLPPLNGAELLEVQRVWAARDQTGIFANKMPLTLKRPFRAPHHSTSTAGLIGGGSVPVPGEISLAHRGVLFLDELPEYKRDALESLREPIESGRVTVSRARLRVSFPAKFLMVAAMNPCPCGKFGLEHERCTCSAVEVARYLKKLSGPLLDRIDLKVWIRPLRLEEFSRSKDILGSAKLREGILRAREIQLQRQNSCLNSNLDDSEIDKYCTLDARGNTLMEKATSKGNISARGYVRTLKVARTIADLAQAENIEPEHLAEALNYKVDFGEKPRAI